MKNSSFCARSLTQGAWGGQVQGSVKSCVARQFRLGAHEVEITDDGERTIHRAPGFSPDLGIDMQPRKTIAHEANDVKPKGNKRLYKIMVGVVGLLCLVTVIAVVMVYWA